MCHLNNKENISEFLIINLELNRFGSNLAVKIQYMKQKYYLLFTLFITACCSTLQAQDNVITSLDDLAYDDASVLPYKKRYFATENELFSFSSAMITRPGKDGKLATLRYSGFFNYGYYFHNNFNAKTGFYTGLSIRNTGFIDKYKAEDSTVKRRLYTLNLPVVFKFGNMGANQYFFVGAEACLALNYKEKGFVSRWDKDKFHKWSWNEERTPLIMPSIFVGYQKGMTYVRLFYYPTNFMNPSFKDQNGVQPYKDFDVNVFGLAIGFHVANRPLFD